jgi:hypothetical protein
MRRGGVSVLLMLLPVGYLAASILIGGNVVYG